MKFKARIKSTKFKRHKLGMMVYRLLPSSDLPSSSAAPYCISYISVCCTRINLLVINKLDLDFELRNISSELNHLDYQSMKINNTNFNGICRLVSDIQTFKNRYPPVNVWDTVKYKKPHLLYTVILFCSFTNCD